VNLPTRPDFQKILDNMIEQYGEEKGRQVYHAWLNKMGYDNSKPMPEKESISWIGDVHSCTPHLQQQNFC